MFLAMSGRVGIAKGQPNPFSHRASFAKRTIGILQKNSGLPVGKTLRRMASRGIAN
jgi:hypothetical protein